MIEFTASTVAFLRKEADDVDLLILAEHGDGSGRRVEVQRGLEFDEQDRAQGQDTYCIVGHTGATHYGGVEEWCVSNGQVEFIFAPEARNVMAVDSYRVTLEDSNAASVVSQALDELIGEPRVA